jgi:hypothetical protein
MSLIRILFFLPIFLFFTACQSDNTGSEAPEKTNIAPSDPVFERVPGAESGLQFVNRIFENHEINIFTFPYLYNGGGVAVIDVNNDGLPDLFFTGTQEKNRLYLNKGNFKFEDITQSSGVNSGPDGFNTGVAVVDINNDGLQDLYICRSGFRIDDTRRNLLLVNNGNNTFTNRAAAYGLDDISASNHANFFDFDGDGLLDMYLLNHPIDFTQVNTVNLIEEDGQRRRSATPKTPYDSDRLYRNNGNGTFTDVTERAGLLNKAYGLSVTVSDFNGDGRLDIYVGNDYIEPDFLYINNGNGTFSERLEQYIGHTSNHTMGVDIADYNNDGLIDLMSLDMMAEDNRRQKALMTTMIFDRVQTLVQYGYGQQVMRNTLQLNRGNGRFSEIAELAGVANTDWSWAVLFADFNNSGLKDLFVSNGYRRDFTDLDYLTYTLDSIQKAGGITRGQMPDFNDFLKLIPSEKLQNYVFENDGKLRFLKRNHEWGFADKSFSNGAVYVDLDGDGDLDLVVNNIDDEAFVYRNTSWEKSRGNYLQVSLQGAPKNPMAIGAKVHLYMSDGSLQYQELHLSRGFFSSVSPVLHFGLGSATEVPRLMVTWPDGKQQEVIGVQANQRLNLTYQPTSVQQPAKPAPAVAFSRVPAAKAPAFVHRENDFEDFNRERLLPHRLSRLGPCIAVGDVNGDGLDDFYIGGASGQPGALYLQQAGGRFAAASADAWTQDQVYEDLDAVFFDANGDGHPDLYVVSGGNAFPVDDSRYIDRLYLNDGKGNFARDANALPRMTSSGGCVLAIDWDGDGDLDLVVGGRTSPGVYPLAPASYFLRNEGGKFTDATAEAAPDFARLGMLSDLAQADLDGDGQNELIAVGEWLPISVFKREGGKWVNRTASFGLDHSNGWWNCIEVADFNGDGKPDILAGNFGLNSRLRAGRETPIQVYYKDFDQNGSMDAILTYFNEGKEYPLARRENLIKQLAYIKKRFVYFRPYSVAGIADVFTQAELADAGRLAVYQLESACFLSGTDGRYQAAPLPVKAQFAPVFGLVVQDFNGDGNLDILLAGNNRSVEVETGPLDAGMGQLLLGDGRGGFQCAVSSFLAPGEVRDMKTLRKGDGRNWILVANSHGSLEVWE